MVRPDTPRLGPIARFANRLGRPFAGRVDLSPEALVDAASDAAGFTGPTEGLLAPLGRLAEALESEARLSLIGRVAARRYLLESIRNRWLVDRWFDTHPEGRAIDVDAPIIVVGLPRTGTTFLHQLLGLAPGARIPLGWEASRPLPPDRAAAIAEVEKAFGRLHRMAPALARMHPMGAMVPQECVAMMAYDIMSPQFHFTWRVPAFADWLADQPFEPVYRSYRRALQCLLWQRPGTSLVLKSPCHLPTLDALLTAFPGACLVHTVRDPVDAVPSGASLVWHLRSVFSDAVDPTGIGPDYLDRWADAATAAMDTHARVADARWCDVHYRDLVADPVGTVARIHDHVGRPITEGHRAALRSFLDRDAGSDRRHRYTLETFGLTAEGVRARFARYDDRFAITGERHGGES